jgi:hypothetical protein
MYLTLCLIVKDENSYLQEWLDYHILLGVDHFWIYDNGSATPIKTTLKSYIEAGWVTIHNISGKSVQLYAYDHCIQNHQSDSKWIGFIDADEFLVIKEDVDIKHILERYEEWAGLAISSLFFGSGGNTTRPSVGQLAGYPLRTPEKLSVNRLVKSIVQPDKVILPISPHSFLFKEGWYCVNESGLRVDAQQFPCHVDRIQVNHYYTRSEQEWADKLKRGRGDSGNPYTDERWTRIHSTSSIQDKNAIHLLQQIIERSGETITLTGNNLMKVIHRLAGKKKSPFCIYTTDQAEIKQREELVDYFNQVAVGPDLMDQGRLVEARSFFASQIDKFPFDVIRYTNFASVCLKTGDLQSAWAALAQAWRIAPQSLFVLLGMIDFFYTAGDYPQAEKTCLLALAQGDLEPEGVAVLALSQWKQGRQEEARTTARPLLAALSQNDLDHPLFKELKFIIQ